jgi:hypothetical protein
MSEMAILQGQLSPIKNYGEFDSLEAGGNAEQNEKPGNVSFNRAERYVQLLCDFHVVAALHEQLTNLLVTVAHSYCALAGAHINWCSSRSFRARSMSTCFLAASSVLTRK